MRKKTCQANLPSSKDESPVVATGHNNYYEMATDKKNGMDDRVRGFATTRKAI